MRKWSEVDASEIVEGEHLFVRTKAVSAHQSEWIVCRWCQNFKDAVEKKPCNGIMKVHLN